MTYDGNSWTTRVLIDSALNNITSVSCVGSEFCVAVDHDGNAITYDGTNWETPRIDRRRC